MFKVQVRGRARKQLLRIPPPHFQRIEKQITALTQNPRPAGCKKLVGDTGYRVRVGDYRILYEINDENHLITIYRVLHRRDVYRG